LPSFVSIATVIQAQVFRDLGATPERIQLLSLHPEFNILSCIPAGLFEGGRDSALLAPQSAMVTSDEALRAEVAAGTVPSTDVICRLLNHIGSCAKYSTECNIIALIYLNRITTMSALPVSNLNWCGIWVVSIILAQKMWDDRPLRTSAFVGMLPVMTKQQFRDLELKALNLIQFSTSVKPSLYAKYYFALRSLFSTEEHPVEAETWALKPLSIVQAKKLEHRSARQCRTKTEMPPSSSYPTTPIGLHDTYVSPLGQLFYP
jgi:hypothetical protein